MFGGGLARRPIRGDAGAEPLDGSASRTGMKRTTRRSVAASAAAVAVAACVATAPDGGPASSRPSAEVRRPMASVSAPDHTGHAPGPFELRAAPWGSALETLIGDRPASVSVAIAGRLRFSHLGDVPRAPASNQKLLASMALLDRFGPRWRIATTAEARSPARDGVVSGDMWIVGHGDPGLDDAALERLAERIEGAGVSRITGSVVGDTSTFRRVRWAPGWRRIALLYISVPTALTFDGNVDASGFVLDPEREAASALTADLERIGVRVSGAPDAGAVPPAARPVALVRSAPLAAILRRQNTYSRNLDAEVLGERLGAAAFGGRGTIAKGARAVRAWAARHGVRLVARDASGLSYANRVTTDGLVRLLSIADRRPWGKALRSTLAWPGVGTLAGRLAGLDVRAKTGTLLGGVSALSGWVHLRTRQDGWAAFSILSAGMSKEAAVALEDAVVRFLASRR
jgi:serine-type D-Ala-D-Ala carboxypeptidase/endopeptidase (penicillin-binding protein 4)